MGANHVGRRCHWEDQAGRSLNSSGGCGMEAIREKETDTKSSLSTQPKRRRSKRRRIIHFNASTIGCALLASTLPTAVAQGCISLRQSIACPAFNASSISTGAANVGFFPFLADVDDVDSFDSGLRSYIEDGYAQIKYQQLLGCSNFDPDDTTDFYARYTTSVLCNDIVQNSIEACGLAGDSARPLCAESCANYAESEQEIAASNVCGDSGPNALAQIRSDFTICALPADSLSGECIQAFQNQPENCGFSTNQGALCSYCSASSPNATDSCCVFADTERRCRGVELPVVATSALKAITMSASSGAPGAPTGAGGGTAAASSRGLTGGQIAGIVVGSLLGALLLLGLVIGGCLLLRRRKEASPATSVFNQPTPSRQPQMSYHDGARDQERGLTALPPRVTRMSALEGGGPSGPKDDGRYVQSTTDEEDSPESGYAAASAPPPKRSGSLSSASQLAVLGAEAQDTSPSTNNDDTSPESQGQSEQLGFFKDYYSQDEIHPGDLVATLWAYEPRAADEFHLERGDMIKVVGIWDDGWATGIRVRQRAEDWRGDDKVLRDSGMSNGSTNPPDTAHGGEVKAFPLVCVCLPQHWRKTIEGESTEGSGPPDIP